MLRSDCDCIGRRGNQGMSWINRVDSVLCRQFWHPPQNWCALSWVSFIPHFWCSLWYDRSTTAMEARWWVPESGLVFQNLFKRSSRPSTSTSCYSTHYINSNMTLAINTDCIEYEQNRETNVSCPRFPSPSAFLMQRSRVVQDRQGFGASTAGAVLGNRHHTPAGTDVDLKSPGILASCLGWLRG